MEQVFQVYCERIKRQSRYYIHCYFNTQINERIKALTPKDRKYNSEKKVWEISTKGLYNLISSYKNSTKIHFDFGSPESKKIFINKIRDIQEKERKKLEKIKELEKKKNHWLKHKEKLDLNFKDYIDITHKNLKPHVILYPFQVAATMFINMVRNVLLAHDMGLGKTLSSIAFVEMNEDFEKVVVITPNSLKHNYYNEVEKFTNSKAHIVNWRKNKYTIEESKYIIVNYEFFNPKDSKKMDKKFSKLNLDVIDSVILDESHRIKNTKSNTYANFKRIFSEKFFRDKKVCKVFMTGTPMTNRAEELYTVMNEVSPIDFPTKEFFYEYYCGIKYNPDSEQFGGYEKDTSQTKYLELYNNISPFVHRKKKGDVLKDLPSKSYQRLILEMSQKEEERYCEIESGVAEELFTSKNPNALTILLRLRQYTSQIKVNYVKEIIDNILLTGEKVVIIDMFKDVLYDIHEMYPKISLIHTGDQGIEERAEMVKKFQDPNSDAKIFLATVQTANYGLTLTAASKMLILTLPYTVGEYDQVSDRIYRIGQESNVDIYPVIFFDTVDEYVFRLIESKRKEIVAVLDNETYISNIEKSTVNDIVNYIKNKYNN